MEGKYMTQVYVKYNPYRLETELKVNGKVIPTDSMLYKVTKGKRMQEWIGQFPKMLREELNTVDLSLEFCGMPLDWDDFEDAFEQAKKFSAVTQITSLAITKLDGTAKGGVVIGISDQLKVPVKFIGLGEKMEDLQLFDRKEFVDSLFK